MSTQLQQQAKIAEETAAPVQDMIAVNVVRLGRKTEQIHVPVGTTQKELVTSLGLQNTEIRLRGGVMPGDTVLENNDTILSVQEALVGG